MVAAPDENPPEVPGTQFLYDLVINSLSYKRTAKLPLPDAETAKPLSKIKINSALCNTRAAANNTHCSVACIYIQEKDFI